MNTATLPSSSAVVEAIDVSVAYGSRGEFTAVKGVSVAVERGELFALLGTNGAGKTSTLETIEGYRAPTSGRVSVFGESPTNRSAVRPRMGIMLQDSGFAGDLTVSESLRLAGKLSSREDDETRVLAAVGLSTKGDTRVAQLSGGERRRLDFAMAVWGSPELIFLDEPTTGLDPAARDALWDVVADLRRADTTIILTTHYLEEAQKYADRIALMHEGRIEREGTLEQLVAGEPSHISFVVPEGAQPPLAIASTDNGVARVETDDVQRDLWLLLSWARDAGFQLDRLSASTSNLDDVFRSLGR